MKLTKAQRQALHDKYGGCCAYCGHPLGERWHADHVEPVQRNSRYVMGKGYVPTGTMWAPERDRIENLMPACPPCNIDKHSLSLEEWRRKLAGACGVLHRNSATYRHAVRFGLVKEIGLPITFYFELLADRKELAEPFA